MSILVIYASIEGQTRKIAQHIAGRLEAKGQSVVITDVREPGFAVPGRFDGIVLCAPIHVGRYPEAFARFVADWRDAIEAAPNAFVSVTLAIHSDDAEEQAEAREFPEKLAKKTGFRSRMVHHAAGALKFLEYDFFKRYLMRRIASKENGPVDVSRDHEFTDWAALDAFTDSFLATVKT